MEKEIVKKRHKIEYPVKVANDFILSEHDLSAASQDMVLIIAKKINDLDFEENLLNDARLRIDAKTAQRKLDTDHRNIKKILKRLREESVDVNNRNTGLILRSDYDIENSCYVIDVDEKIIPNFSKLGKYVGQLNYTIGNEEEHYSLSLKHSKRLYMFFRKIQFQNIWRVIYTVDDLNELFKTKYARYADINRRILIAAVKEINEKTNIKVTYAPRKNKSRAYNEIVFDLEFKDVEK